MMLSSVLKNACSARASNHLFTIYTSPASDVYEKCDIFRKIIRAMGHIFRETIRVIGHIYSGTFDSL